ncbi:MAG: malate/citrate symporter [Candidatus Phytoplasma cynodontis]|uniref:2-hydroxycarboxylate transporter family protein n=1 Tax='Cynodon dactylon' phytoplasma TaxID=295320 RepID=UPI001265D631|nr:2-hydroxycarboxylate transporter family protein ['Cynodon dactylon' phytoplasma]KAB8121948.1 malate:citrate symporter ['Cynodon dactylon' phytoplasma]WIA07642.1 MAG: malate/citrate symporter [Candidatus Phytoplasma cynodontis]
MVNKNKVIKFFKEKRIFGFQTYVFFLFALMGILNIFYITQNPSLIKSLWHPLITPLFIMMLLGIFCDFVGKNIPILNKFGLGFLLCILLPSFLVYKKIISPDIAYYFDKLFFNKTSVSNSNDGIGINFSQFFITIVISGSILSVDRDLLKRSIFKFIPLTLISVFLSILITGFLGKLLSYQCPDIFKDKSKGSFFDSIFFVLVPLTNGGTNLGINGFANGIYLDFFKKDASSIRTAILAPLVLARVLSIFLSGILFVMFDKTIFSGKGSLEKKQKQMSFSDNNKNAKKSILEYQNIGMGMLIIFAFYSVGNVINTFFASKFSFKLDAMVYVILLLLIVKIFHLMSDKNQIFVSQTGQFMMTNFTAPVLAGLGLTTNFSELIKCITNRNILLMVSFSLILVVLITFLLSSFFGFYPLEAALTAGICSHSIGGTGNIGVMAISNRMDLLPFATIATRVVGPIIFSLASISFSYIY